ncbi:[acyl-carrier-protein] S-malonyltransferase [Romboutsia maritimum]|uniref:Malonyl CoA-acyl carrier protein transacylase n=1 Tax=Romboutsia maritimum TaxID=2020948 RepID=A0A371ISS7_9FIRM|nr:ACP S-malonyltransferase [Romboutsia maritimum]RDY23531.1 [acyl-carrier-protein] S-malonyltransferase [Romboutsia maritimum]
MNKKIGFLFPGQGSQYINMGKSLYENIDECRKIFDKGEKLLDMPIKKIIFEGPEETLMDTKNNQPAILLVSLACLKALELEGIESDYVAGLSLGEYSALIYSGVISFDDGVKLIKTRASIMDSYLDKDTGGMAAVLKLDKQKINELLERASEFGVIEAANYNCPGQTVISGELPAIKEAVKITKELKGICIPLKVSGPFHSSLYKEASYKYYEELKNIDIKSSKKVVYSNVKGKPYLEDDDIKELLRKQIMSSVLFEDSIRDMISKGVNVFVEIGPGKTLSNFVKKIDKEVTVYNVEDIDSLKETVKLIKTSI